MPPRIVSLLVVFYTWLIPVLTIPLTLVVLPIICKLLMKFLLDHMRYNSVWDSLQYMGETFVGWFHWFRLGQQSRWSKVYCRLCFLRSFGSTVCTWTVHALFILAKSLNHPSLFNSPFFVKTFCLPSSTTFIIGISLSIPIVFILNLSLCIDMFSAN